MKYPYSSVLAICLLSSFSLMATNITFQVDMNTIEVSAEGVSVVYAPPTATTFGDLTIVAMDDSDGDGIYTATSDVPHDIIGYYFVNGGFINPANYETVPEECSQSITVMGITVTIRPHTVENETTLPLVCFASCSTCAVSDCDDPSFIVEDDASDYELGNLGANGPWQLWPGASLGVEIDTFNGDNVFSMIGDPVNQDVVFATGDLTSGHYIANWRQYIPAGNAAYFNIQHQLPTAAAGFWAIEVNFAGKGQGVLELSDDNATEINFTYPEDEFFTVVVIMDLDNDEARLIVGETTVGAWRFSDGFTNGATELDLLQLSAINFYSLENNYVWFFDDVVFAEVPAAGEGQYCYTATTIEPGVHNVDELECFGGGIHFDDGDGIAAQWFQYTPTENGWISLSSCEGGADSRGWILAGECHNLDIIGVNDDQCATDAGGDDLWASYREAVVEANQTYYIMWDDVWDETGFDFELTFNTTDLVEGDFCESAQVVTPGLYDILEFTGNAAVTGPTIGNTSQGRTPTSYAMTEWYQYTPTADGAMTIASCEGSASDNRVWVYIGECGSLSSLALVASDDDGCGTGDGQSLLENVPVTAGTTYYIEWDNGWSDDSFTWELIGLTPQAAVTFRVDMNLQDISPEGVFVAGSFSNFDNVAMDDADADGVYEATISIDQSSDIEYKFKNGPDGWEDVDTSIGDVCTIGEFGNRFLTVGSMDMMLDPVCFAYCVACDQVVDIDELTFAQSVQLFPNPTNGQVRLDIRLAENLEGLQVQVFNLLGSSVLQRQLGSASYYTETLDLSQLPTGTYLVRLTSGELQLNRKIVVR